MSTFVQSLPLIGVLMFLAVGLVWRPWLHYPADRQIRGFVLFQSVRAGQVFRDGVFVFVMVAAVAQAVVTLVRPDWLAGMARSPCRLPSGSGSGWWSRSAGSP